jgi:hypothetical protein
MEPAHSIARLGFRKWYERRLIEGYAWLVTALLCGIVVALSLEASTFKKSPLEWLGTLGVVYVAGLIAWQALRRFLQILSEAGHLAGQSTCQRCASYGTFNVTAESPRMTVRCHKCGHEWTFD